MRIKDSAIKAAADWLFVNSMVSVYCGSIAPGTLALAQRDPRFRKFAAAVRRAVKLSEPKEKK